MNKILKNAHKFNAIKLAMLALIACVFAVGININTHNTVNAKSYDLKVETYNISDIFNSAAVIENTGNAGKATKVEQGNANQNQNQNQNNNSGGIFGGLLNGDNNQNNEGENNNQKQNNNNGGFFSRIFGQKDPSENMTKDGETKLEGFLSAGKDLAKDASQKTANTFLIILAKFIALISLPITVVVIIFSFIRDGIFGIGKKKDEKKGHKTRNRILIFFLLAQILPLIVVLIIKGWG